MEKKQKTLTKSHDYSLLLRKAPTKNLGHLKMPSSIASALVPSASVLVRNVEPETPY